MRRNDPQYPIAEQEVGVDRAAGFPAADSEIGVLIRYGVTLMRVRGYRVPACST